MCLGGILFFFVFHEDSQWVSVYRDGNKKHKNPLLLCIFFNLTLTLTKEQFTINCRCVLQSVSFWNFKEREKGGGVEKDRMSFLAEHLFWLDLIATFK